MASLFFAYSLYSFLCSFRISLNLKAPSLALLDLKMKDIFPWKDCLIIISLNLFLGVIFYSIHWMLCPGETSAIIMACLWGIVYFLILRNKLLIQWRELNAE